MRRKLSPVPPPSPPESSEPPDSPTNLDTDVVGVSTAAPRVGQQDVLGLQVSVDDAFAVQQPHGACDLLQEEPDGVLAQGAHGCRETSSGDYWVCPNPTQHCPHLQTLPLPPHPDSFWQGHRTPH